MSGILGLLYQDQRPVYEVQLQQMAAAIAHRGPDAQGLWLEGSIGLGHQMLWTTPESLHEALPYWDKLTQLAITADVRLDNRANLIDQLQLHSSSKPPTDSQLLIAAYQRWHEACPEYLLGDFAFAIWDAQNQTIFCARDHFGVKPFYFYRSTQTFAFASEIKALLALNEVPAQLNETKIADYLTGTFNDQRITLYQNIWRLPPAHTLRLQLNGEIKDTRYWQLDPAREITHRSAADYAQEYRHHFLEAVQCRMRSHGPVGAHLSGGLDSSSVACTARYLSLQHNQGPIHTFSHVFPDVPASDEREFIDQVLTQGHFTPHIVRGDTLGALTEWKDMFSAFDEAMLGNGYYNWIINRSASENGVRVLMSGFDGDMVVGHGLTYLTELAQNLQWQTVVQEATQFIPRYDRPEVTVSSLVRQHTLPMLKKLAQSRRWLRFAQAVQHLSPAVQVSRKQLWYEWGIKEIDGIRQIRQWRAQRRQTENNPYPFANPELLERLHYQQRRQAVQPALLPPQSERKLQWQALTSGLAVVPLETVDPFSAFHGVETRHPFMDKRLVEYCLALPASQKLNQGWTRAVMRRGMEGILPPTIQWRGGKGIAAPAFFYGIETYDRPLLEQIVSEDLNRIAAYCNVAHTREVYPAIMNQKSQEVAGLWSALNLALWFRYKNLHS